MPSNTVSIAVRAGNDRAPESPWTREGEDLDGVFMVTKISGYPAATQALPRPGLDRLAQPQFRDQLEFEVRVRGLIPRAVSFAGVGGGKGKFGHGRA